MATSARLQQFYIAYYGRPADVSGLDYWLGITGPESNLVTNFGSVLQAEFSNLYGDFPTVSGFVDAVYTNLFGRGVDGAGLAYWTGVFNDKVAAGQSPDSVRADMVMWILDGAQSADRAIIDAKSTAAQAWTAAINTTEEIIAYDNVNNVEGQAVAREWLAAVVSSGTAATQVAAGVLNAAIAEAVAGAAVGQEIQLTASATDNLSGGRLNDTFIGQVSGSTLPSATVTLHGSDVLNGGLGKDTLRVTAVDADATVNGLTATGLEQLDIRALGANLTLGLQNVSTELNKVISTESTGNITLNSVNSIVNLDLTGNSTSTNSNVTVAYDADVVVGAADAQTIALDRYVGTVTENGIENITLTTSGHASSATLTSTSNPSGIKNLTISGNQNLTLGSGSSFNGLQTVAAAGLAADLTLTSHSTVLSSVVTGTGNDILVLDGADTSALTVNASSGNNNVTVSNALNSVSVTTLGGNDIISASSTGAVTVSAGDGTNTGTATSSAGAASATGGSGVDTLTATGATGATVIVGNGAINTGTATSSAGAASAIGGTGNDTLTAIGATGATVTAGDGTNTGTATSSAGAASATGGSGVDTLTATGATGATVNVGNGATNTGTATSSAGAASAIGGTGNDTLTATGATSATVTAGEGNNTSTATSSAGSVSVTGGAGVDAVLATSATAATVNVGAGNNDVEVYAGTTASVTTTTGDDTVYVESGTSTVVDAGAGNNDVEVYAGTTASVTTTTGNDTVYVESGANITVNSGNGDDYIEAYSDTGNIAITAGNAATETGIYIDANSGDGGNVTITVGTGVAEIYAYGNVVTIAAGAGNKSIDVGAYDGDVSITTNSGNDVIDVGDYNSDTSNDITINAGEGNNEVYVYDTAADALVDVTVGGGDDYVEVDHYSLLNNGSSVALGLGHNELSLNYFNNEETGDLNTNDINAFDLTALPLSGNLNDLELQANLIINDSGTTLDLSGGVTSEGTLNADVELLTINDLTTVNHYVDASFDIVGAASDLTILSHNEFGNWDYNNIRLTTEGVDNLTIYADDDVAVELVDPTYQSVDVQAWNNDAYLGVTDLDDISGSIGSVNVAADNYAEFDIAYNSWLELDIGSATVATYRDTAEVYVGENHYSDITVDSITLLNGEDYADAYVTFEYNFNSIVHVGDINIGQETTYTFADPFGEGFTADTYSFDDVEFNIYSNDDHARLVTGDINIAANSLYFSIEDNIDGIFRTGDVTINAGSSYVENMYIETYNGDYDIYGVNYEIENNDDSEVIVGDITINSGEDALVYIYDNDYDSYDTDVTLGNVDINADGIAALQFGYNDGYSGDVDLTAGNVTIDTGEVASLAIFENDYVNATVGSVSLSGYESGIDINYNDNSTVDVATGVDQYIESSGVFSYVWVYNNDNSDVNLGDITLWGDAFADVVVNYQDYSNIDIGDINVNAWDLDGYVDIYNNYESNISTGAIEVISGEDYIHYGEDAYVNLNNNDYTELYVNGDITVDASEDAWVDILDNDDTHLEVGDITIVSRDYDSSLKITGNYHSYIGTGDISLTSDDDAFVWVGMNDYEGYSSDENYSTGVELGDINVSAYNFAEVLLNGEDSDYLTTGNIDIYSYNSDADLYAIWAGLGDTVNVTSEYNDVSVDLSYVDGANDITVNADDYAYVNLYEAYDVQTLTVTADHADIYLYNVDNYGEDNGSYLFTTLDLTNTNSAYVDADHAGFSNRVGTDTVRPFFNVIIGNGDLDYYADTYYNYWENDYTESREVFTFAGDSIGDIYILDFSPSGYAQVDGMWNDRLDFSQFDGLDLSSLGDMTFSASLSIDWQDNIDWDTNYYAWDVTIDFVDSAYGQIVLDNVITGNYQSWQNESGNASATAYYNYYAQLTTLTEQDVLNLVKESCYFG